MLGRIFETTLSMILAFISIFVLIFAFFTTWVARRANKIRGAKINSVSITRSLFSDLVRIEFGVSAPRGVTVWVSITSGGNSAELLQNCTILLGETNGGDSLVFSEMIKTKASEVVVLAKMTFGGQEIFTFKDDGVKIIEP